ncbi:MAG: Gfo/Idh/MocA family protein [Blastocatellia bacterium]
MSPLRFAIFGAGFWSRFQLAAWKQLPEAECVAIYNRTRPKAEALAREFGVPAVYDDPEELLNRETLDFIDIITDNSTHGRFVRMAASRRLPVICQKPIAPTLAEAESMFEVCREAGVPFFIHENYRWQAPIRALKGVLERGEIGAPYRARIECISAFPDIVNQPFLAELEQYLLADMGTHILDLARFLFGEAERVYCQTYRNQPQIKGEDVATVMIRMKAGNTVLCQLALATTPIERDYFPQTFFFIEGEKGSVELGPNYWIRVTTEKGTHAKRYPPPRYQWADPDYDVVHASIVDCHANLLGALQGKAPAETTAEDNLKTLRLVFAAYESAREAKVVTV